jgi:hypothetical protein
LKQHSERLFEDDIEVPRTAYGRVQTLIGDDDPYVECTSSPHLALLHHDIPESSSLTCNHAENRIAKSSKDPGRGRLDSLKSHSGPL